MELAALQGSYDERDGQLTHLDRDKASLAAKVDEMQAMLEDETRQKLSAQARAKTGDAEIGQVKEMLGMRLSWEVAHFSVEYWCSALFTGAALAFSL